MERNNETSPILIDGPLTHRDRAVAPGLDLGFVRLIEPCFGRIVVTGLQAVAEVYRAMETERRHSNPDAFDLENSEGTA